LYNTPEEDHSVVIRGVSKANIDNLADLQNEFLALSKDPTESNLRNLGTGLAELLRNYRSPALGIGNETIKQTLKDIDTTVTDVNNLQMDYKQRLDIYGKALSNINDITLQLNQQEDHIRLAKLRSIRNYKETLDEYNQVNTRIEDNQIQLDKARQAVANTVWYFNNNELSTRALEKQDPEIFSQWFGKAKEERNNFNQNRGGILRAPDQPTNTVLEKTFKSEEPSPNYLSYLFTFLPVLLVIGILYMLFTRQMR